MDRYRAIMCNIPFINEDNAEVKLLSTCEREWIKRWCDRKDFYQQNVALHMLTRFKSSAI